MKYIITILIIMIMLGIALFMDNDVKFNTDYNLYEQAQKQGLFEADEEIGVELQKIVITMSTVTDGLKKTYEVITLQNETSKEITANWLMPNFFFWSLGGGN